MALCKVMGEHAGGGKQGGIKEEQTERGMKPAPAAGATPCTCETVKTWPKKAKQQREAKWKTKMNAGGAGAGAAAAPWTPGRPNVNAATCREVGSHPGRCLLLRLGKAAERGD